MPQDGAQNAIRELRRSGKSDELEVSLILLFHPIISFDLVVGVLWYSSTRGHASKLAMTAWLPERLTLRRKTHQAKLL